MTAANWEQVKSIFLAAVEVGASGREAFLAQACAGDPALREKVDHLLNQHEQTHTLDLLPATEPARALVDGEVLSGRFRILKFVGRGGMGEVYHAADLEIGGEVALKILQPELLRDPRFLGRFRREVQLARQVTHPNVCRIFDVGRHQDGDRSVAFLTMEFLPGETLSQRLRRDGPLPSETALPIIRHIAAGLTALHDRAIVHRDFKPGNIMIAPACGSAPARTVITDFGLARSTDPGDTADPMSLTKSSQVLGTPEYMAPEQLLGKPVTPAADIFAFGIVLYEMVTGRKPFPSGRSVESAMQRLRHVPESPRHHTPDLNKDWENTILRCLEKDPEKRPTNPDAVLAGLSGALPPSPATLARHRGKNLRAGAAALALIILAAFLVLYRSSLWSRWTGAGSPGQHVAVLSFKAPENNVDLRMFADGLAEGITSRLSQYERANSRLLVVPASEVRRQGARTPSEARTHFGASEVIEGSVQGQGDRVRLLLTLVDTAKGIQTGTVVLEDRLSKSFELQDAAVERLAQALRLRIRTEATPAAPAQGAYEYYLQARGYLQRNDRQSSLQNAVALLKRATAADPAFAPAHSALAQAYFHQFQETREPKTLDMALASGNHALQLAPELPETNIAMGRIYYGTGRNRESLQLFEKAISADPRNHEAYQGLAAAFLGLRDFNKAEQTYKKAIAMRPADWTGYKALGLFYYEREDYTPAAANFRKVVELTPDNAKGFLNLGAAEAGRQDWEAAEKAWLRALELDPKDAGTLSNLGKIYLDRGETQKAIDYYRRSLDINPRSYRAWGQLGRAYQRLGRSRDAGEALNEALEMIDAEILVNPKRFTLHYSLAFYRALLGRGDYLAPLQTALDLAPDNADVLLRAAETYAIAGDNARAKQCLARSIARGISPRTVERSEYLTHIR